MRYKPCCVARGREVKYSHSCWQSTRRLPQWTHLPNVARFSLMSRVAGRKYTGSMLRSQPPSTTYRTSTRPVAGSTFTTRAVPPSLFIPGAMRRATWTSSFFRGRHTSRIDDGWDSSSSPGSRRSPSLPP
ncbi:unnamed protein product, partial [Ectocarpus sp. 8 AP-2014]